MFNGMILSGTPQGPMSSLNDNQNYNHKLFMGGVNQHQIGGTNQANQPGIGNTSANNMQNDL